MGRAHRGCKGRWKKGTVYRRQAGNKGHRRAFCEQERPPELQVHGRCSKGHMFVFSGDHPASSLQLSHLWPGLERALLPVGMQARVITSAHQSSSSCKTVAGAHCPSRDPVFSSGDSFGLRGIPKPAPSQALPPQFVFQRSFQGGETRKGDPSGHNTNAWRSSQGLGSSSDRK